MLGLLVEVGVNLYLENIITPKREQLCLIRLRTLFQSSFRSPENVLNSILIFSPAEIGVEGIMDVAAGSSAAAGAIARRSNPW